MRAQDFETVRGELLDELEGLLVAEHAAIHRDLLGEDWSPPHAYRWMRYESPDPAGRLLDASQRLSEEWAATASLPGFQAIRDSFRTEESRHLARALRLAREAGFRDAPGASAGEEA